jgi:hypothetical protein
MVINLYIYLDESGDLGFDFANKKPSRYFVMTALVCKNKQSSQIILQAVRRTLKNKSKQIGGLDVTCPGIFEPV